MLILDVKLSAEQALEACRRRGLVIRSQRELAGRTGSRHWHLHIPGRSGTIELNEWHGRVWVKVHPLRDGGWASAFAHELSASRGAMVPRRMAGGAIGSSKSGEELDHVRITREFLNEPSIVLGSLFTNGDS